MLLIKIPVALYIEFIKINVKRFIRNYILLQIYQALIFMYLKTEKIQSDLVIAIARINVRCITAVYHFHLS